MSFENTPMAFSQTVRGQCFDIVGLQVPKLKRTILCTTKYRELLASQSQLDYYELTIPYHTSKIKRINVFFAVMLLGLSPLELHGEQGQLLLSRYQPYARSFLVPREQLRLYGDLA
jgi:hypothetical protein